VLNQNDPRFWRRQQRVAGCVAWLYGIALLLLALAVVLVLWALFGP
jgi:hypothetical protein